MPNFPQKLPTVSANSSRKSALGVSAEEDRRRRTSPNCPRGHLPGQAAHAHRSAPNPAVPSFNTVLARCIAPSLIRWPSGSLVGSKMGFRTNCSCRRHAWSPDRLENCPRALFCGLSASRLVCQLKLRASLKQFERHVGRGQMWRSCRFTTVAWRNMVETGTGPQKWVSDTASRCVSPVGCGSI